MLLQASSDDKKGVIEKKMLERMREILLDKNLDYVQFSVRFVDEILPDRLTGKKPLIVTAKRCESDEMEEAV